MTTETPSAYARAEAGSRQIVLQVGLGVVAFVVGGFLSAGAGARVGERLGPIETEAGAMLLRLVFERLWLVLVLPVIGFAIGRFSEISGNRFALTAGLSGEVFSLLLVTAINGLDYLLEDSGALAARGATLFIGLMLTSWAVRQGRAAAAEAQGRADVIAAGQKAEYAAFLAAAQGKSPQGDGPPAPAAVDASEKKSGSGLD